MSNFSTTPMPKTISKEKLIKAVETLGINPYSTKKIEIYPDEILVEAFLTEGGKVQGKRALSRNGTGYTKTIVTIPVRGKE